MECFFKNLSDYKKKKKKKKLFDTVFLLPKIPIFKSLNLHIHEYQPMF